MAILDDATRIRLRADVPWGAFLSGGVDSSTIVGLMARHVDRAGQDLLHRLCRPALRRIRLCRQKQRAALAATTPAKVPTLNMLDRWPHVLHHLDQPHGDISFMPTLRVSELAARHVKVVLTGDGGDELFAGYDKVRTFFAPAGARHWATTAFQRSF
jgi:asparagine synthase (glutamine-hydrolysing)